MRRGGSSLWHLMRQHLMRGRCLRFAARIAPTPRKTPFRLVVSLCRTSSDPRGSLQSAEEVPETSDMETSAQRAMLVAAIASRSALVIDQTGAKLGVRADRSDPTGRMEALREQSERMPADIRVHHGRAKRCAEEVPETSAAEEVRPRRGGARDLRRAEEVRRGGACAEEVPETSGMETSAQRTILVAAIPLRRAFVIGQKSVKLGA
jgi:hypothetical protein